MENVRLTYCLLRPTDVDEAWPVVAPWILPAIADEPLPMEVDYIKQCAERAQQLIFVAQKGEPRKLEASSIEAVLVAEIAFYLGVRTLICRWLGGKSESASWLEHISFLEAWAQQNGFLRVEIWGRKGWERIFKPHGYVHESTHLGKFLRRSTH
jgi:hypothetical protein